MPDAIDAVTLDARVTSPQAVDDALRTPTSLPLDRAGAGPRRDALPLSFDVMTYPPASRRRRSRTANAAVSVEHRADDTALTGTWRERIRPVVAPVTGKTG